jgi:putative transposase
MMYIRYPLSLRQVEDLLFERGIDICHETVRFWWNRFGPKFAAEIRKRRSSSVIFAVAMKMIGNTGRQECGRWLNIRAENSHQPFRRREGEVAKFRDIKTLRKFASVHASIHNYFNQDRHLSRHDIFKQTRSAVLAEWCQLAT